MYPADRNKASLLAIALLAFVALPAAAKSTDRQQPMDVQADTSSALLEYEAVSTLDGNVVITQVTLNVKADHGEILLVGGDIREVVLTGDPARLHQIADNGDPTNATASRIVYTLASEQMVLTGNV